METFTIPAWTNLVELTSAWTPINSWKQYECAGKLGSRHTSFWETDRERSTFEIFCGSDGYYEWRAWPTCLEDVTCSPLPPEIPTHSEYWRAEDDGEVRIYSVQYPSLTTTQTTATSSLNNTLLPRNFNTSLDYSCGQARQFFYPDGSQSARQSMRCGWDRAWSPSPVLGTCDWVACLQPPLPPPSSHLRVTGWAGSPIPFGDIVHYVCQRGYHFQVSCKI